MQVIDEKEALGAIETLLRYLGEDLPLRAGVSDTPRRVLAAFSELVRHPYPVAEFQKKTDNKLVSQLLSVQFSDVSGYRGIVALEGISFVSVCEHHLLPFFGTVHITYQPKEDEFGQVAVVGLSKLARLVDHFSRRLQMQERLTADILEALVTHLKPEGVFVQIEATHTCLALRGAQKREAKMSTQQGYGSLESKGPKSLEL